jgi:pilus assembly protein Flp/PilA
VRQGQGDEGASAVEYGLIVFAIAAAIVGILWAFSGAVRASYDDSCDRIAAAANQSQCQ